MHLDRNIARTAILSICHRLRAGHEARLDRNLLASSFPPGPDGRPFEIQLLALLHEANDGIFLCRTLPGGDCSVLRRVRKALLPDCLNLALARGAHHAVGAVSIRGVAASLNSPR